jgi:hypothetical protein
MKEDPMDPFCPCCHDDADAETLRGRGHLAVTAGNALARLWAPVGGAVADKGIMVGSNPLPATFDGCRFLDDAGASSQPDRPLSTVSQRSS